MASVNITKCTLLRVDVKTFVNFPVRFRRIEHSEETLYYYIESDNLETKLP